MVIINNSLSGNKIACKSVYVYRWFYSLKLIAQKVAGLKAVPGLAW